MKTIDTKSLLLGVLTSGLIFTLTSSKTLQSNDNIEFIAHPSGVGIYNKASKTIYVYRHTATGGIKEKAHAIYKVSDDGSSLKEVE